MRRIWITLLAVAMAVIVTIPATAAPPANDWCGDDGTKPDHPSCSDTPTPTTPEPPLQSCEVLPSLSGPGYSEFECAWTPEDDESLQGEVTLTVTGGQAAYLAVFVRDSSPGNICALETWDKPTGTEFTATFPLVDERGTYWSTGGTDWCAPYDEFGPKEDLNGEPLNLRVILRGKKTTTVEVALKPVQAATP